MCFASWQLDSRQLGFPGLVVNQKTFQAIKFPGIKERENFRQFWILY